MYMQIVQWIDYVAEEVRFSIFFHRSYHEVTNFIPRAKLILGYGISSRVLPQNRSARFIILGKERKPKGYLLL